jgi:hypothetical protein
MIGQGQAQDVVRSIDIWGPDLGSLKGKTTSHKAQLEEEIPILKTKQFKSETMYLDLMFVNGLPFLIAVVNPLEYVMVNKLSKRDNWTLWGSLESDINHITKSGFKINMIRVDGEGAINTEWFENRIAALGIILDTTVWCVVGGCYILISVVPIHQCLLGLLVSTPSIFCARSRV